MFCRSYRHVYCAASIEVRYDNLLEAIPDSFKSGLVVPVYKSSGKDPLKTDSIEVSLFLQYSQVLEFLILDQLETVFMEGTACESICMQKVSCADAISAAQISNGI